MKVNFGRLFTSTVGIMAVSLSMTVAAQIPAELTGKSIKIIVPQAAGGACENPNRRSGGRRLSMALSLTVPTISEPG